MEMPKNYGDFFQKTREVYSWMEDEQSKRIFEQRFLWSGTANPIAIETMLPYSCKLVREATKVIGKSYEEIGSPITETVVIYGAGLGGKKIYLDIHDKCKNTILFMDRNADTIKTFCGCDVIAPETINTLSLSSIFILCASGYSLVVRDFLLEHGVLDSNIYLGTEGDVKEQYFDDVIQLGSDEIFADVGCFNGFDTLQFVKRAEKYKKIFCFEPEPMNIPVITQRLEHLENIQLFSCGLWHEKAELYFSSAAENAGCISAEGSIEISVEALDDLLEPEDYPTFIKMDIEGAELNALHGAKKVIQTNKPKLAISIYHKPEDILELIIFMKELVPDYKFYLRHYTNKEYDTVLYAVIER